MIKKKSKTKLYAKIMLLSISSLIMLAVPLQIFTHQNTQHLLTSELKIKTMHQNKEDFLAEMFKEHQSPCPKAMAKTVLKTSRPALYASLSMEESGGDPNAIGDGGKSYGAFQIQAQYWGHVPRQLDGQADKAQQILEGHIKETKGNLRKALAMYNGGDRPPAKSYRYADRIITRAHLINKKFKEFSV